MKISLLHFTPLPFRKAHTWELSLGGLSKLSELSELSIRAFWLQQGWKTFAYTWFWEGKRQSEMEGGHSVSLPSWSLTPWMSLSAKHQTSSLTIVIQSMENYIKIMDATKKSQLSTVTQMYYVNVNKCIYFYEQLNHSGCKLPLLFPYWSF